MKNSIATIIFTVFNGSVLCQPNLTINPTKIAFETIISNSLSTSQSYQIQGSSLTKPLIISTSGDFEISEDDINFASSITKSAASVNGAIITIHVRFAPKSEITGEKFGIIKHKTEGLEDKDVLVSGKEFGQTALPAKRISSKALILTSTFNLPIVRFNRLKTDGANGQSGNVEFFNSVGAGLSFLFGRLEQIQDNNNKTITSDFANTVGITGGFLFAANVDDGTTSENIFATTIGLTFLDFQVGLGWEHGDRSSNTEKLFVTISYGIPLTKVSKKSGVIIRNWKDGTPSRSRKKGRNKNKISTRKPIETI